jgi:hypothetical protein
MTATVLPPFIVLRKYFTSNGGFLFFAFANNASRPCSGVECVFVRMHRQLYVFVERYAGGNCSLNRRVFETVKSGTAIWVRVTNFSRGEGLLAGGKS